MFSIKDLTAGLCERASRKALEASYIAHCMGDHGETTGLIHIAD